MNVLRDILSSYRLAVFSNLDFQIRGFPTIKVFRKGEEPEDFQGGRTRSDIVARAMDLYSDNIPAPQLQEVFFIIFGHLTHVFAVVSAMLFPAYPQ